MNKSFYMQDDVVGLARNLLGKVLVTRIDDVAASGIIAETEAYHESEKACHAYRGRRTRRTELLFGEGGYAYVYLCYGIHHLFNVVTGPEGIAQAVLIRAVFPLNGVDDMMRRRRMNTMQPNLSSGPGTMSQALGITTGLNGADLTGTEVWIEDRHIGLDAGMIASGPRIGVDYAGKDALLPWRFYLTDVSRKAIFQKLED